MAMMIEEFEIRKETKERFHERMSNALRRSGREDYRKTMEQWRTLNVRTRGTYDAPEAQAKRRVAKKINTWPGKKKNQQWQSFPNE